MVEMLISRIKDPRLSGVLQGNKQIWAVLNLEVPCIIKSRVRATSNSLQAFNFVDGIQVTVLTYHVLLGEHHSVPFAPLYNSTSTSIEDNDNIYTAAHRIQYNSL